MKAEPGAILVTPISNSTLDDSDDFGQPFGALLSNYTLSPYLAISLAFTSVILRKSLFSTDPVITTITMARLFVLTLSSSIFLHQLGLASPLPFFTHNLASESSLHVSEIHSILPHTSSVPPHTSLPYSDNLNIRQAAPYPARPITSPTGSNAAPDTIYIAHTSRKAFTHFGMAQGDFTLPSPLHQSSLQSQKDTR